MAFLQMMDAVTVDLWCRILGENVIVSREVCKWLKKSVDAHSEIIYNGSLEIMRERRNVRCLVSIMFRSIHKETMCRKAMSTLVATVSGLCGMGEEYQRLRASNSQARAELFAKYMQWCDEGGLTGVTRVMRRYMRSRNVINDGCQILMYVTRNDEIRAKAGTDGTIWVVIEAMRQHESDAGVQMWACRALVNLFSFGDNHKEAAVTNAALDCINAAIHAHSSDSALVQAAHEAICNLAFDDVIQIRAVASGACERAVRCMLWHSDHSGVVREVCTALFNLCFDRGARKRTRDAGGEAAIMEALAAHPCDDALVREAMDTLRKIREP